MSYWKDPKGYKRTCYNHAIDLEHLYQSKHIIFKDKMYCVNICFPVDWLKYYVLNFENA